MNSYAVNISGWAEALLVLLLGQLVTGVTDFPVILRDLRSA